MTSDGCPLNSYGCAKEAAGRGREAPARRGRGAGGGSGTMKQIQRVLNVYFFQNHYMFVFER